MKRGRPLPADRIARAYRVRIEPTVEQAIELQRSIGIARKAYNWALDRWRRWYHLVTAAPDRTHVLLRRWGSPLAEQIDWAARAKPNAYAIHAQLTAVKHARYPWMAEVSALVVREAVSDVGAAYEHFFRRLRKHASGDHSECTISRFGRHELGEPRFRSRNDPASKAFHVDQGSALAVRDGAIKLPVIGLVKIHPHQARDIPGNVRVMAVGIRCKCGHWYAAIRCEADRPAVKAPIPETKIAAEVGLRSLVVTSDGRRFGGMREIARVDRLEQKLQLWQRRASRRYVKGKPVREQSAGWREAQAHVVRYHAQVAAVRGELLHHASNQILKTRPAVVVMRAAAVRGMISRGEQHTMERRRKRNRLARAVAGIGWYELTRKVEYKQDWRGGSILRVPRDEPTTRRCSRCGHVRDTDPGYPNFHCANQACGHTEDREANSAWNLYDYRAPSGDPADGGRTARRRQSLGTATAGRTGMLPAGELSLASSPDGDATSPHGAGKAASGMVPDGKGAVICDPTPPSGEPEASHLPPRSCERQSDATNPCADNREVTRPDLTPKEDRSQTASQVAGSTWVRT